MCSGVYTGGAILPNASKVVAWVTKQKSAEGKVKKITCIFRNSVGINAMV